MKSLTDFFKALADPTRMEIVRLLKEQPKTPSELLESMNVSQPTLSHHLDILKRAELIDGERNGQFIRYSLNMTVFDMAMEYLVKFKTRRR
jgi:DNA-binding transcriptional ArsR family regulator